MSDPRTGGHFDNDGNWHDDHPDYLADLSDNAFLVSGIIRIIFHLVLWGSIATAAWVIFKTLVQAAL